MAGRSKYSARSRSPRRSTTWMQALVTPFLSPIIVPAFSLAAVGIKPAEMQDAEASTIVRSYVTTKVQTVPTVDLIGRAFAFGLTIVSDEAFAAGTVALANPLNSNDADWLLYYQGFTQPFGFSEEHQDSVYKVDSKAMRKIQGENKTLVLCFANGGSVGLEWIFQSRILFKLS